MDLTSAAGGLNGEDLEELVLDCAYMSWLAHKAAPEVSDSFRKLQDGSLHVGDGFLTPYACLPQCKTCPELIRGDADVDCYVIDYNRKLADMPTLVVATHGACSWSGYITATFLALYRTQFYDVCGEPLPNVLVNLGFYRQLRTLSGELDRRLDAHLRAGHSLVCTGHGLGGAVSQLIALRYATHYRGQIWYVGFGSPRVGNIGFANEFESTVKLQTRVKNARDPVTALPPISGYLHAGPEMHLGAEDPSRWMPNPLFLGDHHIRAYVQSLVISKNVL